MRTWFGAGDETVKRTLFRLVFRAWERWCIAEGIPGLFKNDAIPAMTQKYVLASWEGCKCCSKRQDSSSSCHRARDILFCPGMFG